MPFISAERLIRALEKLGCATIRQRGSHVIIINYEKRTRTTVTVHPGEIEKQKIRTILKQIGISEEELRENL